MRRLLAALVVLLLSASFAVGQELVYFEGDLRVYERVDGELFELQDSQERSIDFGYMLDLNYVVRTYDGFAEILLPNGHVLKLAEDTEVQLENVVARGAASGDDVVRVAGGRLRSVVATLTGSGRGFQVQTPTAVGGVRGTDFVTQVSGGEEIIAVKEGSVTFTNADGSSISLTASQFANALAASFQAAQADVVEQFYGALNELSEGTMDAQERLLAQLDLPEEEPEPETALEDDPEDEPESETESEPEEPEDATDQEPDVDSGDAVTVQPVDPARTTPEAEPEPEAPEDGAMTGLASMLGLEIGSLSVEGETYSKVVVQPVFQFGELRAGLYLPIIYSGNLFDPHDWYRPDGNNEWSFGSDQDWANEPLVALGDLAGDLALKIKFLEWGEPRDPFFLKVGNLNTLQLGHGLLMRNYANDTEFPAIRRIGFNVGIDFGGFGFEALTNDLADPEIFGARLYARPIASFPLAIGVSGVADIAPASDLPMTTEGETIVFASERMADPIFLNFALDLDFPIVESDPFSLVLFGDVGGFLPYLRNGILDLEQGFQTQALFYETGGKTELRNYGIATGVFGNALILDYRLEFQNYHGIFEPAFYDANYDRTRGRQVTETLAYLLNPEYPDFQNQTLGVYGEAGFDLAGILRFEAGYLWPWTTDPSTEEIVVGDEDFFQASLVLQEGLLPLGISAGISYERTFFAPTLLEREGFDGFELLDENTVLKGEVVYPVAPIMDLVASVTTTVVRDADGNIVYTERDGYLRPTYGPVVSIQTRIGTQGF